MNPTKLGLHHEAGDGPLDIARRATGECGDFEGASVRVAWGKSGLGMRPVGSNAEGAALARAHARERGRCRVNFLVSDWQRLTDIFSKILNRSAQSGE
jgi:anaerobic selenocysteine-containing dehydrogenase